MRIPRKRMFRITVNGTDSWTESAGERTVLETQHQLVTEIVPGGFVRVQEFYIGGAAAPRREEEDEDGEES